MENIHQTILKKFMYPDSLIKEYNYWYWLIRPEQITLGSSIIITKSQYDNFSDLPEKVFHELQLVIKEMESGLRMTFQYNKINHLMLMMNDPTVHFHTIPRYKKDIIFQDKKFIDKGFPGIPDFSSINKCTLEELTDIKTCIIENLIH